MELISKYRVKASKKGISIFDLLDISDEIYGKLPDNEVWLDDYLKKQTKATLKTDKILLTRKAFSNRIRKAKSFRKALMRIVVEICTERDVPKANRMDFANEERSYASTYDPSPTKPSEFASYDEPVCAEEAPPTEEVAPAKDASWPAGDAPHPAEPAHDYDEPLCLDATLPEPANAIPDHDLFTANGCSMAANLPFKEIPTKGE